jgi:uncharacterized membrane protein YesL
MNKLFGYDSKVMQILNKLADLILMNLLFIVCCIPIFTIGAAQAGLYRAVIALQDPQSDYTWFQAFFKGFKDGFWRITIAWCILLVLIYLVGVNAFSVIYYDTLFQADSSLVWACLLGAAILMMIQSVMTMFHSKFGCTVLQLFRNALNLIVFNLWRCVVVLIATWLPGVIFLVSPVLFIQITPLWILGYYAICFYFCMLLFRVPFAVLVNHYNETHGITKQQESEASEEELIEECAQKGT